MYEAYIKLLEEAKAIDNELRYEYMQLSAKINSTQDKDPKDLKRQEVLQKRQNAHDQLLASLLSWNMSYEDFENPKNQIKLLKRRNASLVFDMFQDKEPKRKVIEFLEIRLADIFHKIR